MQKEGEHNYFSELFSAFDYIDEAIYICDMDTYDLVYCNKKLEENLLDAYQANQSGYKCYKLMPVSVNVSRISMYNPTTVQFLKDLVVKYQLHPKYLELELTESAYMDDPQEIKKQLRELQDYGFRILMDDFGSGYSSLNTLRELPVNGLKLDKEFPSESSGDERGRMILASVVSMNLGCEYVQGFLFARPMPVEIYEQVNVDRL